MPSVPHHNPSPLQLREVPQEAGVGVERHTTSGLVVGDCRAQELSSLSSQLENRTHTLARLAAFLSYLTKLVCRRMRSASYLCTKYSSHTLWQNTVPGSFTSEILLSGSSSLLPVLNTGLGLAAQTAGRSTETVWRGRGVPEGREYKAIVGIVLIILSSGPGPANTT